MNKLDLNKLSLQEILDEIKKHDPEIQRLNQQYEQTLTPEQKEINSKLAQYRNENLAELWKIKHEKMLQEVIEKTKKENETIKEVTIVKEVPVIKETAPSQQSANTNEPKTTISTPKILNNSRQHYLLPLIIKTLSAKCHTWLVGPSGSGKSTLAAAAARELKLPYAALSVCSQTTKTDFLGYLDAHGVYRSTSFREIYENGGVFCLDEVDNGNANVLAVLNSALAGESNVFPDKSVVRHPNFVVIACANTFGLGSSASYVGRSQIDAATLDRFFFVEMPYDDGLEAHVAGIPGQSSPQWDALGKNVPSVDDWLNLVKKTRETVTELGIRTIISPRATYTGISLIKQGVPLNYLEKGLLYKSMTPDTIAKIRQA